MSFWVHPSDESLVCLANQSWWVYVRRLVKAPSSFYNHLRQLLLWCIGDAVYFYCYAVWQSVASSLRQCVGRVVGGSSFTLMAGRKNKGILEDPQHCLKCTRPWCKQVQCKDFMFCEIIESWVQVKNAGWRFPGWCLLSSEPPASALFAQKCATNVLSDVRRTGKIVGGRVLMLFVVLSTWLHLCTCASYIAAIWQFHTFCCRLKDVNYEIMRALLFFVTLSKVAKGEFYVCCVPCKIC